KRRNAADNWYQLDFGTRKKLMSGHARVGRKFAGRVSQLITGSTGIDDWEWGVTLMAHQVDALKEIVYEMRFDEVSARYGEFGPFYINLRLSLHLTLLWPVAKSSGSTIKRGLVSSPRSPVRMYSYITPPLRAKVSKP